LAAGHDKTRLPGSATAVVLQLDADTSKLIGANLVNALSSYGRDKLEAQYKL
jgi:hypothetical protein